MIWTRTTQRKRYREHIVIGINGNCRQQLTSVMSFDVTSLQTDNGSTTFTEASFTSNVVDIEPFEYRLTLCIRLSFKLDRRTGIRSLDLSTVVPEGNVLLFVRAFDHMIRYAFIFENSKTKSCCTLCMKFTTDQESLSPKVCIYLLDKYRAVANRFWFVLAHVCSSTYVFITNVVVLPSSEAKHSHLHFLSLHAAQTLFEPLTLKQTSFPDRI